MTHGSVFSGVGGFDLAAEWMGWENIFHCELNPFGQKVLKYYFPNSISYNDITKTDFSIHRGSIDVLTGGFPCQDASIAKQDGEGQQGLQGDRTGLFWDMVRAIDEVRPRVAAVFENVANILKTNGGADFSAILTELSRMGYNAEWRVCSAAEIGAPHQRERLYLIAYPSSIRLQEGQTFFTNVRQEASQISWEFAGTTIQTFRGNSWMDQPPVLLVDDGIPCNMVGTTLSKWRGESIKAAGNAIVPQVALQIFKAIQLYENQISSRPT
jgi:DNA (cytosine-5)-methyltransferase 1